MAGRAERLILLYKKLKRGQPLTLRQVHHWGKLCGMDCSLRQWQRDLTDLCTLIDDDEEQVVVIESSRKEKRYYLNRKK